MAQDERELEQEELEDQAAVELPERHALTLISTGSSLLPTYPEPTDVLGSPPSDTAGTSDAAAPASDQTGSLADATEASGSESGTTTVTEEDRSEQITQTDSAFAGPS